MAKRSTRAERREQAVLLLTTDYLQSDRSIGRAAGMSHTTVAGVRAELELAGRIDRRTDQHEVAKQATGGQNANLLRQTSDGPPIAATHGAYSEGRLAPLRMQLEQSLTEEYGHVIDARRLWLGADLLARVEAARVWLDAQGGVVRNRQGEVFAVVDRLERWGARADGLLREWREAKEAAGMTDPQAALEAHLLELEGQS